MTTSTLRISRNVAGHLREAQLLCRPASVERLRLPSAGSPALDERVPGLLFDSIACVQAVILSASRNLPYGEVRQVIAYSKGEKCELTRAALAVAAKHPAFFSQHKEILEFAVAWARVNAAQMEQLYSLADERGERVCSVREAVGVALIVLAPLAILTLVLIMKPRRE